MIGRWNENSHDKQGGGREGGGGGEGKFGIKLDDKEETFNAL